MRTLVVVGIVFGVIGLVAGCGSEAEGSAKDGYIQKADEICAKANRKIQAALAPDAEGNRLPMPIGSASGVSKVVIPTLVEELRELHKLAVPPGDTEQIGYFLADAKLMIERAQNNPPYVAKAPRPFLRTELQGERYGFSECGHI
ncbi:MAG TPA: hypothetical protein VK615_07680 [Candidatus Binatia bacterium]|nr:hypothetical protein [Candidatus Binatia bacterium]